MEPLVLARKPSGLALVQLSCGCEQWMRVLADGSIHTGRRAKSCGPGGVHGAPDFADRLDEAARHLARVQEVSP
jgi:hypothetical protein